MAKRKNRVRISGVVKAARLAREELAVGIPPEEVERFRDWIRSSVKQIETICRKNRMRPKDLPTPSYRAYRFLKGIDLNNLPEREGPAPEAPRTIHISGLIALQNDINERMARWAESERAAPTEDHPRVQALMERLTANVERIEELAQEAGATPGHLPTRSQRAYQWLKFLSDPITLVSHLETLRALQDACQNTPCRKKAPRAIRKAPVKIAFTYASYLYKVQAVDDILEIKLHEGFISAPSDVLQGLACVFFSRARDAEWDRVRTYAASEDFIEVVTALEMTTAEVDNRTQGRYFDLEAVFERVNQTYFGGELDHPRLTWNTRITQVKMGHYDPLRDTVMLSVTLDTPDVPDCVVDYVMYHELLHKKIGKQMVNGRHYAHTPAFREAERAFAHYEEAQAFLNKATSEG
jgi:hypothetical protein